MRHRFHHRGWAGSALAVLLAVAGPSGTAQAAPADARVSGTTRASISSAGVEGDGDSRDTAISADGRYVAFTSTASTLVPGDTNLSSDVFLRDLRRGTTTRVSVSNEETQANGASSEPAVSADGRYVVFLSEATNLIPAGTDHLINVFIRDLSTGTTSLVSQSSRGAQPNLSSYSTPAVSADGRYVAFTSEATNLVPGDTNDQADVFVRDRHARTTTRVSVSDTGGQANNSAIDPAISADGRYVAFASAASSLVGGDTNNTADIFVRDRLTGVIDRANVSTAGAQAQENTSLSPAISADGRFVTFTSSASNLVAEDTNRTFDIYVRDRRKRITTRASVPTAGTQAQGGSWDPAISANGRYVAFRSAAPDLVPGDTNGAYDMFVRDRRAGTTTRVSVSGSGAQGNGYAGYIPAISSNGRRVAFSSGATNLVTGDTNDAEDVFVHSTPG